MKITKRQLRRIIREATMPSSYAGRYRSSVSSHGGGYRSSQERTVFDDLDKEFGNKMYPGASPQRNSSLELPDAKRAEIEVKKAYRQGRSSVVGKEIRNAIDDLYYITDEPEMFGDNPPTKDEWINMTLQNSEEVNKDHLEFLWQHYVVSGKEL